MPTYTAGHGPYRKGGRAGKDDFTEQVSDTPDLDCIREAVKNSQADANWFIDRNRIAFNSWHARWRNQTADGRRWPASAAATNETEEDVIWPWPGASDTRVRTVDKIIRDHLTVAMFAVMNMKVQAKSTRPAATTRESQQATTLINWMLFTHMNIRPEVLLALNWRFALGASAIENCWETQRRIDYTEVTVPMLTDLLMQHTGENATIDQFSSILMDPAQEDIMISFAQQISPIISVAQARGIVNDLRTLRYAEIPIPYVYVSRPRWTALRLMVDLIIPAATDNLQRTRWADRVEWVTETELVDRIETQGYDANFVDEAIDHKGRTSNTTERVDFTQPTGLNVYSGQRFDDLDERIELHHFWQRAHDRGVPTVYTTTFHMDVEGEAKHGPCEYEHGEFPFFDFRNEHHERAILSSRGWAEVGHPWQNEIKVQRDGRTDRTDLALRPPLLAPYQDVQRMKQQFQPGVIIPERRDGSARFFNVPGFDQGSVEIERALKQDVDEFVGLFGENIDPQLKQQRQMEVADEILEEFKPLTNQTYKLLQQYLPDSDVAAVVGPLSRPFQVDRKDIQAQPEITMTVDMRELDAEWLEKKGVLVQGVLQMDTAGIVDRATLVKNLLGGIDYTLADMSIQDQGAATEQERDAEIAAVSNIIGSGLDLPLPKSGNFQLRLQTLTQTVQDALQNNPATRKKLGENPDVLKVLEKRQQYFQNQLQQQENAQIGRSLSTRTFTKQAPMLAAPGN